jgi:hypothetical protein
MASDFGRQCTTGRSGKAGVKRAESHDGLNGETSGKHICEQKANMISSVHGRRAEEGDSDCGFDLGR